jgi:hypothetical protein
VSAIASVNKLALSTRRLNYHYVAIVACSVVAHGLLLLNDGVYWDGWLIYTWLADRNWGILYSTFSEAGTPLFACFHWLMGYLPATIFSCNLLAFIAITSSGILVYLICNELKLTSRLESLFIALIFLSYPAFQASVNLIITPFLVYYVLFLLAGFLALKFESASGFSRQFLHASSLVLWALSFALNSLLVFYYGFLLLMICYVRKNKDITLKSVFTRYLPRRMDYMLLPLLYWFVMRGFFPPHGDYSQAYQFSFSPLRIITIYFDFIMNTVYAQLNTALGRLILTPALGFAILLVMLWVRSAFAPRLIRLGDNGGNRYAMLFFGLFLLALAIFPYAAVGRVPLTYGWNTRHAILVSLPMAVILVAITRLCFDNKNLSLSKVGPLFLAVLILAFSLSSIASYLSWQALWVKDRSVMTHLTNLKDAAEGISVFWIDDKVHLGDDRPYAYYEWSSMFKTVWGGESRVGLDKRSYTSDFLREHTPDFYQRYNLSEFDPAGCQAILTIRPGSGPRVSYDNTTLSFWYFIYKFIARDRLNQFLLGLTDVQIERISAPEALNCPPSIK